MYLATQSALILFYLAVVGSAIGVARSKYHTAFGLAIVGAITCAVGSLVGGVLGGFLRGAIFGKTLSPSLTITTVAIIVGAMAFAGLGEEVARIVVLRWRYWHRNDRLEHMVMFGAGFGGLEVAYRAYARLAALIGLPGAAVTGLMTPWGSVWATIQCVEIFIWHILLTLLVYRAVRLEKFQFAALAAIVIYHFGLDVCGGMIAVLFGLGYGALFWSVLTAIHVPVILRLLNVRVPAPVSAASIAG